MNLIKPTRLKRGDTVAVLSPSWGGPSLYPHVFDLGLDQLKSRFGLKVKEFPTARRPNDELYLDPKSRAGDLNRAFADPEVGAMITSIGGDDSVRILPYLDVDLILKNPKVFMGFSDTTTMLSYLNTKGLVTFNGPSIMAGFAQMSYQTPRFAQHVEDLLMNPTPTYRYETYGGWADGYLPWQTPGYAGETKPFEVDTDGWQWLQGRGKATGPLFGGNVEVLEFLKGTDFWPSPDFWNGRILFLESSEEKPTVSNVKYMLRNYGSQGVLERIAGILVGRPMKYSAVEKLELYTMLATVVGTEFGRPELPIIANLDFGHTDPQWVMPLGIPIEIDVETKCLTLVEPAVL
jgi:muramoyltetrapeptide carboxypeptidase LdcA involved in peptidoglycan recycling